MGRIQDDLPEVERLDREERLQKAVVARLGETQRRRRVEFRLDVLRDVLQTIADGADGLDVRKIARYALEGDDRLAVDPTIPDLAGGR